MDVAFRVIDMVRETPDWSGCDVAIGESADDARRMFVHLHLSPTVKSYAFRRVCARHKRQTTDGQPE